MCVCVCCVEKGKLREGENEDDNDPCNGLDDKELERSVLGRSPGNVIDKGDGSCEKKVYRFT